MIFGLTTVCFAMMAVCELGWRLLGIGSFIVGPVTFFFLVSLRVHKLVVKEKTLAFVPVPSRSWKERWDMLKQARGCWAKSAQFFVLVVELRFVGVWTKSAPDAKFWGFCMAAYNNQFWQICIWMLSKKFIISLCKTVIQGRFVRHSLCLMPSPHFHHVEPKPRFAYLLWGLTNSREYSLTLRGGGGVAYKSLRELARANALLLIMVYMIEFVILVWKRPFRDGWLNISGVLTSFSNFLSIGVAALPLVFPDFEFPGWLSDVSMQLAIVSTAILAGGTLLGPFTNICSKFSPSASLLMTSLSGLADVLWVRLQLICFDRGKKQAQRVVDAAAARKAVHDAEAGPREGNGDVEEVRMELVFDIDMGVIADDKEGFKAAIVKEVATALGGDSAKIRVLSLQPYAVTHLDSKRNQVRLLLALDADVSDQFCEAPQVVEELKRKTANPDSRLMQNHFAHVTEAYGCVAKKPAESDDLACRNMLALRAEDGPLNRSLGTAASYCVLERGEFKCFEVENLVVTDKHYDLEASVPLHSFSCDGI